MQDQDPTYSNANANTPSSNAPVSAEDARRSAELEKLIAAKDKGVLGRIGTYTRLSGPGWLQSAITLGGGSLAGSLYLGVIGGYQFMWLQPLMMILGIVMLSAIAYVTLSSGERPFRAINKHVNPVLGWGWLIAAMMANLVWAMPQFSLGTAAIRQNLFDESLGEKSKWAETMQFAGQEVAKGDVLCAAILFILGAVIVACYNTKFVKLFDWILKLMVGTVVVSFFGVVAVMTTGEAGLPWGEIGEGFIPNLRLLVEPASSLLPFVQASGAPEFWTQEIVTTQQQRMIAAAATAVGINMTFLLPYSMLRKGWGGEHRGLATFDLSTGLFIPFLLATSCVVIAAATQFHAKYDEALISTPAAEFTAAHGRYKQNLEKVIQSRMGKSAFEELSTEDQLVRVSAVHFLKAVGPERIGHVQMAMGSDAYAALSDAEKAAMIDGLTDADKQLSQMLIPRDAWALADSLSSLTGESAGQIVFGVGVLGMAVSTIIILMLINGFCVAEMFGTGENRIVALIGSLLPGFTGAFGVLLLWSNDEARFWLAVPTSNFGMILLPVAYLTFLMMMNNRDLMGFAFVEGGKRLVLNVIMLIATGVATVGAGMSIWNARQNVPVGGGETLQARWVFATVAAAFILLALIVQIGRGVARSVKSDEPDVSHRLEE